MTVEQVQKLSLIFRQTRDVVKRSIDDIAQLAEDALTLFADDENASVESRFVSSPVKELLTIEELAERWKVSVGTIRNLQVENLPTIRFGKAVRFDYEDCLIWAKDRKFRKRGKTKLRAVS